MASASPSGETFEIDQPNELSIYRQLRPVLLPLASLKLTVALFVLSLILIMVGTLAQVEADIWDVVRDYFRCWAFWMPVRVWHPLFAPYIDLTADAWYTRLGIPFPGGKLIGLLMGINLLAAHTLKFTINVKGKRLVAGAVTLLIGILATWMAVESGHSDGGSQDSSISWDTLWNGLKALAIVLCGVCVWSAVDAWKTKAPQAGVLSVTAVLLASAAFYMFTRGGAFDDSSMRILWQLVKGQGAALVLLAGCVLLFRKRCGVVLLHGGIALVMLNELVVYTTHVEQQMTIEEGHSANFAQDIREYELVLIDRSGDEFDNEIIIPRDVIQNSMAAGASADSIISHEDLPFDVEIVRFLQNSNPMNREQMRIAITAELGLAPFQSTEFTKVPKTDSEKVTEVFDNLELEYGLEFTSELREELTSIGDVLDYIVERNPATAGAGATKGQELIAAETRPGAGTDSGGAVDVTSCYVRLLDKDTKEDLGTYLTNVFFQLLMKPEYQRNYIVHEDTRWDVELRFRRYYKPFSVHLNDVSKTDYVGTSTPRDYRSKIRLVDPSANVEFDRDIWMNNPLRYAGETFYQTNYFAANPSTGEKEKTTLSVVSNTGWLIPYVACMIVQTGMLAHFWIVLLRFLRRRESSKGISWLGFLVSLFGAGSLGLIAAFIGKEVDDVKKQAEDEAEQLAEMSGEKDTGFTRIIPWVAALVVVAWLGSKARPPARITDSATANLAVTFADRENADTITRGDGGDFVADGFVSGRSITVTGSSQNDGRFIVAEVTASVLTLGVGDTLSAEEAQSVTIAEEAEPDYYEFGKLPLVYEGRVKPFDTLARNSLRLLSNRQTFVDKNGDKQPAIIWLLDVISGSEKAREHRVFRVDHPELVSRLDLPRRKTHLYSLEEIVKNVQDIAEAADEARRKDAKDRDAFERKLIELESKFGLFDLLYSSFAASDIHIAQLRDTVARLDRLDRRQPPLAIAPAGAAGDEGQIDGADSAATTEWKTFARGFAGLAILRSIDAEIANSDPQTSRLLQSVRETIVERFGEEEHPPVLFLVDILEAHASGEGREFNSKVAEYQQWLEDNTPSDVDVTKTRFEAYYNHFAPFYYASVSYLYAFIFAVLALLGWSRTLNRTSFLIIATTLVLHTFALCARIYISGRPPVTNLYSSAVFIGWGCVVLGMIFESIYRLGIGNIIGSALGAGTLLISYLLSGDGDTFKVMQAVLDTQFWLATHVVCITLGYSTTFLAGAIGILYILLDTARPVLRNFSTSGVVQNRTYIDALPRMIYGTVCFGIFFSFVGTVLGGLWADDSWGRFWGWDPKENGALMIVVWNALLLHARWDKMVKDRGLAVLSIGGNIVTAWSWFGVNELSVGLHAYGFTEGVWFALWMFWLSQLALIGIGCMPSRWFSGSADTAAEADA